MKLELFEMNDLNRKTGTGSFRTLLIPFLIALALFTGEDVFCQTSVAEIPAGNSSLKNAIDYYHRSAGQQAVLYSGVRHEGYTSDIIGNAYFMGEDWQPGRIYFDGILYDNIPMLYDELKDELLVRLPGGGDAISLVSERVDRFFLSGHTFVRIHSDGNSMAGFYDLISNGKTAVLVKRKKIIHESSSQDGVLRRFLSENRYYLRKGDHYFAIRSMKNVLGALSDKKNEIRQLFNDRKLNMKADPEGTLLEIAAHYDKLNTSL